MFLTTHITRADCMNKKGPKSVGTVVWKYNGRIISQPNWLHYSKSFDSTARQLQPIKQSLSFKKDSVQFEMK